MKTITKNLVLTESSGFERPILGRNYRIGTTAKWFEPYTESIQKRPENYYRNMKKRKLLFHARIYCDAVHARTKTDLARSNITLKDELERRGLLAEVLVQEMIKEAKKLIANEGIRGRQEFGRKHGRFYQKLCKLDLMDMILPKIKERDKEYDLKTDDELIEEAVGHMKEEKTTLMREFARKHRYLYDELNKRGLTDRKELREIMMINADLYLEKRHEFFLGENSLEYAC